MPNRAQFLASAHAPLRRPLTLALASAFGVAASFAQAATIAVTSPGDSDPVAGTGTCTLRQAINTLNHGSAASAGEGGCRLIASGTFGVADTIAFDTGSFPHGASNRITLAYGRLDVGNADLVIDAAANGNVTIDAHHASGIINDSTPVGALLTLNHLTLSDANVTANDCNGYAQGGAICIPFANLDMTASTISGNSATWGGGIYSRAGNITLSASTLSGNSAANAGGAIYSHFGDIALVNSTLSGNAATKGGAIYASNSDITLASSTVSANSASDSGGALYSEFGNVRASDSILAGNSQGSGSDVFGIVPTGSGNLIGAVENLKLGALADNGGPTWTMLPQAGSVAIDAIDCTGAPAMDQRVALRPDPGNASATPCDIGAAEANSVFDRIFADGFDP
jgi:hypothetical protein